MAYLDPASNPGSKPQRLSDRIAKVALGNKITTVAFYVNFWEKTLFTRNAKNDFECLKIIWSGTFAIFIT